MDWHDRIQKSAKHYLGSLMFLESAKETYAKAQNTLLAVVGLYYSSFHSAVSLLWLSDIESDKLHHIKHSQLQQYVSEKLVQKRVVDQSFLTQFKNLQKIREYANYKIGSKVPKFEYQMDFDTWINISEKQVRRTTKAIKTLLPILYKKHELLAPFEIALGDGFGDDILRLHLGNDLEKRVEDRLIEAGLTT
jgi:uncharacterized protein (UPF0332 family)